MPKTPDEIKKGLECCKDTHCKACPYFNIHRCAEENGIDALALIQQLQDDNAEKDQKIRQLEAQNTALSENIMWMEAERDDLKRTIRQLQAERDAAVAALKSNCVCTECKWFDDDLLEGHCNDCHSKNSSFEWRGVQKEDGNEKT